MTVDQEFVEITDLLLSIQQKQLAQDIAFATLVGSVEAIGGLSQSAFAGLLINTGAPSELQEPLNEIAKMLKARAFAGLRVVEGGKDDLEPDNDDAA